MTKPELVTLIMENTTEYKKTHLMEMHKADLERIAAAFAPAEASAALSETEAPTHVATPDSGTTLTQATQEAVEAVYDEYQKMVKGSRMDKEEFRATAIEAAIARLDNGANPEIIRETVVSAIKELLEDKVAFCPINDNEKLMLATIPRLPDFTGLDSVLDGKGFLEKVQDLHGVSVATSRALMVSLMRKRFYQIIGKKSGQKKTTIKLQSRGIRYLIRNGLYAEV